MIHYDLRCRTGHAFDGWFRNSAAFDQQARSGLLGCPICGSAEVSRAIMAPRLSRNTLAPAEPKPAPRPVSPAAGAPETPSMPAATAMAVGSRAVIPDQVKAVLQKLRAEVEQRCDYVGPRFADVARAMHDGGTPHRPIYGEATPDQADALAEDGIEVARIPWVSRADG